MSFCVVNQSNNNCYRIKEISKQITLLQKTINTLKYDGILNQFTLRPNYTGPKETGLYTDWESLYEDLDKITTARSIFFDNTYGNITIPARTDPWDMTNVSWITPLCVDFGIKVSVNYPIINISDGATFNHLCIIDGLMQINYQGTTSPAMILDTVQNPPNSSAESLLLKNGAYINCTGSQPFIKVNTDDFACILDFAAQLNSNSSSTYEVFDSSTSGYFQIIVGYLSNIRNNSVRGTGTIHLVKMDLTANISTTQINAPLVNYDNNVAAGSIVYNPSNVADWNGVAPNTVSDALDRIAAFIATNIGPIN